MLTKNKSTGLPLISDLSSSLNHSRSKVSAHSVSINQKYIKKFEIIQRLNDSVSTSKLYQYKLHPQNYESNYQKLDTLISSLDNVKEPRFVFNSILLTENDSLMGYIDKGNSQFFEISVRGRSCPLRIQVKVKKGKIQCFTSFTNPKPDKTSFDTAFENGTVEIYGMYHNFIENFCFLGIFADEGSSVSVSCFFNLRALDTSNTLRKKHIIKKIEKYKYISDIKEIRTNPDARMKFENKIKEIIDRRKVPERKNFVETNKSNLGISEDSEKKGEKERKIKKVKSNKLAILDRKLERLKESICRKEIRKMAENKAQEIQGILFRKLFFEKTWLNLIYFSIFFVNIRLKFQQRKKAKLEYFYIAFQVYKIQKKFKKTHDPNFSFNYRILAIGGNNLKNFHNLNMHIFQTNNNKNILNCIKQSAKNNLIIARFEKFYQSSMFIRFYLKIHLRCKKKIFLTLLETFNRVIEKFLFKFSDSKKRKHKKNNKFVENLSKIEDSVKESLIENHILKCKQNYLKDYKSNSQREIDYKIDEEIVKSLIFNAAKVKTKKQTNSSKIN